MAEHPVVLLRLWEDISSFGGILGGLLGIWLFLRLKSPAVAASTRLVYFDAVAFVFPFALAVGRVACSLAHDHPGTVTSFPLAISLESPKAQAYITGVYQASGRLGELPPPAVLAQLGFHDLGWYELLYLGLVVLPTFALLGRRGRPAGFFVLAFIIMYMPVRFALDFLRVADARYLGLTPAQYVASAMLLSIPLVSRSRARRPAAPIIAPSREPRVRGSSGGAS